MEHYVPKKGQDKPAAGQEKKEGGKGDEEQNSLDPGGGGGGGTASRKRKNRKGKNKEKESKEDLSEVEPSSAANIASVSKDKVMADRPRQSDDVPQRDVGRKNQGKRGTAAQREPRSGAPHVGSKEELKRGDRTGDKSSDGIIRDDFRKKHKYYLSTIDMI